MFLSFANVIKHGRMINTVYSVPVGALFVGSTIFLILSLYATVVFYQECAQEELKKRRRTLCRLPWFMLL